MKLLACYRAAAKLQLEIKDINIGHAWASDSQYLAITSWASARSMYLFSTAGDRRVISLPCGSHKSSSGIHTAPGCLGRRLAARCVRRRLQRGSLSPSAEPVRTTAPWLHLPALQLAAGAWPCPAGGLRWTGQARDDLLAEHQAAAQGVDACLCTGPSLGGADWAVQPGKWSALATLPVQLTTAPCVRQSSGCHGAACLGPQVPPAEGKSCALGCMPSRQASFPGAQTAHCWRCAGRGSRVMASQHLRIDLLDWRTGHRLRQCGTFVLLRQMVDLKKKDALLDQLRSAVSVPPAEQLKNDDTRTHILWAASGRARRPASEKGRHPFHTEAWLQAASCCDSSDCCVCKLVTPRPCQAAQPLR